MPNIDRTYTRMKQRASLSTWMEEIRFNAEMGHAKAASKAAHHTETLEDLADRHNLTEEAKTQIKAARADREDRASHA